MFGFVMASMQELTKEEKLRYSSVYCGICRQIRLRHSTLARLGLRYDMAFLSMLLMSLYEPEESCGKRACGFHPIQPRAYVDNCYIRYGADMNVALAYYKALDDANDENKLSARALAKLFGKKCPQIAEQYPRQTSAIANCISQLSELEKANCTNPDEPAACFGKLMAELFVYEEDVWAPTLREMGMALGRYIYLADAAVDFDRDRKKKRYNPFLAMQMQADWVRWEQYLVLEMERCMRYYEHLPLVQDKSILDNILYSGVWLQLRNARKKQKEAEND